jgi:plastocyanin
VTTNDATTARPFDTLIITDPNPGQTDTVTLTLSTTANGTLSNLGIGGYDATTGIYTATGSSVAITAALNVLVFTPNAHQVAPGQTVTTTFTIVDTDTAGVSVTDSTTSVIATTVGVPPTITGTAAGQATTDRIPITPFPRIAVTDVNAGQTETVTVTLSAAQNGTLINLGGGGYSPATGVWSLTGPVATVTSALDGLAFVPTAQQFTAGQTVTTTFTISVADTAGLSATNNMTSITTLETSPNGTGLLGGITISQQLQLIYVAYFNRAADSPGFAFWGGQSQRAQTAGQSAAIALTNVANAFTPQPETIALYPFLAGQNTNLNTPAEQTGLGAFTNSVYDNLFGHVPDAAGRNYWVGQVTSGAVGAGAAALAIANGATGPDAIELLNKIAVAYDFTTRTAAAGIGATSPLPVSFITAAETVMNGVDGASLNDASVTAAINATATYLAASTQGVGGIGTGSPGFIDPNVITVTGQDQLIDPGPGNHTIRFLPNASGDTIVPHADGVDQVSGFDPGTDFLDLRSLLVAANINPNTAVLGDYLTVTQQATDALIQFDPTGLGRGAPVAVLWGLGDTVTELSALIADKTITTR